MDDGNDGVDVRTIVDQGDGDANGLPGMVQFNQSVGGWLSNVTIGTSYPSLGTFTNPQLDLFSLTLSTLGTGGTIAVSVYDEYASFGNLDSGISGFIASIGGTSAGTVDFMANINGVDLDIDWGEFTHSWYGFSGAIGMDLSDYSFADADTWDMTLTAVVQHNGAGITTLGANIAPVPEPATILLFGAGLVGLAGFTRRKKVQK
ncbi:PEP-CTERM sorting domain-containing protein [Desulforhopalus sp. IMCC35007]|uniref:PEP-CTERM sorting domain-containing protein n=1 Tax=Desulforhopalus sp. IMCC35007 TaxID=2569543 RepID=UPI0010AEBC47|nr:PEP-CTERM sorting domain-containing protein [Desulforhopalus sp. IMCC35007]TKB12414.1 PEP-CTERM sorting domain-containing protein [Desulforhopalus sp. IMCC35007]